MTNDEIIAEAFGDFIAGQPLTKQEVQLCAVMFKAGAMWALKTVEPRLKTESALNKGEEK